MTNNKLKSRNEIENEYKWDIEKMYKDVDSFNLSLEHLINISEKIKNYKGKLDKSEDLIAFLKLDEEISRLASSLYVYANLKYSEDTRNVTYQQLKSKMAGVLSEISSYSSYFIPEILSMDFSHIENLINSDKFLDSYRFLFEEIYKSKPHILSASEEEILAKLSDVLDAPDSIFETLTNADLKFGTVKDDKGNDVTLTEVNYSGFIRSENREVRKSAFKELFGTYEKFKNTFSESLSYNVKKYSVTSKIRNYSSSLEAALKPYNIPTSVYTSAVKTINENLHILHKYVELKKRRLSLDEIHMYDIYTPIFDSPDKDIKYEDSVELVTKALKPLGEEYVSIFSKGIKDKWIDVYPNEFKRSGAFSYGSYDSYPYILLNYEGKLRDVSTLAHEMGHSMHSYYTRKTQPYHYGSYSIFLAEIASTTNEILLSDYLIKNEKDKDKRLSLINEELEQIRATVYRQILFAEFELTVHNSFDEGTPLTVDDYVTLWTDLNKKYFGNDIVIDPEIGMEWARIPHFYSDFYVYQYATGYAAATAFASLILEDNKNSEKFIDFLKSGSSNYPIDILRKSGIDMTTSEPLQRTLDRFEYLLDLALKES